MKKIHGIQYILLAIAMVLPMGASAATFSLVPKIETIAPGNTMASSVYVNPGAGETITATKVSILFPAATIEVLSYTPVSGGSILAHIGTKTNNVAGTITDNVAFNPGVTAPIKIATIVFKAKKAGTASVTFGADSQLLNSKNTNENVSTAAADARFTVKVPVVTPKPKVTHKVKKAVYHATHKTVVKTAAQIAATKAKAAKAKAAAAADVAAAAQVVSAQASTTTRTTATSTSATSILPTQTAAASGSGTAGKTVPYAIAAGVIVLALLAWLNRKRLFSHTE